MKIWSPTQWLKNKHIIVESPVFNAGFSITTVAIPVTKMGISQFAVICRFLILGSRMVCFKSKDPLPPPPKKDTLLGHALELCEQKNAGIYKKEASIL